MLKVLSGRFTWALAIAVGALAVPAVQAGEDVRFKEHRPTDTRLNLPLYSWQNDKAPKAVMLCLHGFPMHGRTFDTFAREMVAQGFAVYAPDMRGLGNSYFNGLSPRLDYLGRTDADLALVAAHVRAKHPGLRLFVTGESMGGSFALRLAEGHPKLVDGLIVSGPGLDLSRHYLRLIPSGFLSVVTQRTKVDFSTEMRDFFSSDPRVTAEILRDPLVRRKFTVAELMQTKKVARQTSALLSGIPANIPVLVLQARDDEMCLPSGASLLRRELKSKDLTINYFDRRGHVLLETQYLRKDTLKAVTDWLKTHNK